MERAGIPADASAFIYLAKADAFPAAHHALGSLFATPAVWREVVTDGRQRGYADAEHVVAAHEAGMVVQIQLTSEENVRATTLRERRPLGSGESETIAVAGDNGRALVDDRIAARVARELSIITISTLAIPLLLARRGWSQSDALALLQRLAIVMGARADQVVGIESDIRRTT